MSRKKTVRMKECEGDGSDDELSYLGEDTAIASKALKRKKRNPVTHSNGNVIKYYENLQFGNDVLKYRLSVKRTLIESIKTFKVFKVEAPFDRRVTYIEWHPTDPNLLAVASKSGDIYLWNHDKPIHAARKIRGIGAGGSIQAMKFDNVEPHKLYTVSLEGKFLLLDFQTKRANQFLNTMHFKKWYVSLDINWYTNTMAVGDNCGLLTILSSEGLVLDKLQIHKTCSRVTHLEFSKRDPWLLCSTSNDRTIKFWDVRNVKRDTNTSLARSVKTIKHVKPLNSAYFSLTDGSRLLTTDQFDKIQVFRAPLWRLETEIDHPHRQFQHLTPIKAYWHPFEDIILVGRYPHTQFPGYTPGELRTIDFFDANTGMLLHQHSEPDFNGIVAINKFNSMGDVLASGSGTRILIWKPAYALNSAYVDNVSKLEPENPKFSRHVSNVVLMCYKEFDENELKT